MHKKWGVNVKKQIDGLEKLCYISNNKPETQFYKYTILCDVYLQKEDVSLQKRF